MLITSTHTQDHSDVQHVNNQVTETSTDEIKLFSDEVNTGETNLNGSSLDSLLFLPPRCSTPVTDSSSDEDLPTENNRELFHGCSISEDNFLRLFCTISAKHCASDEHNRDLLRLFRQVLPEGNNCPGLKKLKNESRKLLEENTRSPFQSKDGEILSFFFVEELLSIVDKNFSSLINYSKSRVSDATLADMKVPPFYEEEKPGVLSISLLISLDGVSFVKSASHSLWPLWTAIVDLPPELRYSFENIVLCSLWFGTGKPSWEDVFSCFSKEINRKIIRRIRNQENQIKIRAVALACDNTARSSVTNLKQYNGMFGCTWCTDPGFSSGPGLRLYSAKNAITMRTVASYQKALQASLDNQNDDSKQGVIGYSSAQKVLPAFPLTCAVDYMHTVCLGVTKRILIVMYSPMSKMSAKQLEELSCNIKLPTEFSRSVRALKDLHHFKASEFRTWLLYIGPVLFKDLNNNMYLNLLRLSFAIRSLLETDFHLEECDQLLNSFCASMADFDAYQQTFNLHSLRHLTWQVRNLGPLWTTSCFAFESAHNALTSRFTGTVNHLNLLA